MLNQNLNWIEEDQDMQYHWLWRPNRIRPVVTGFMNQAQLQYISRNIYRLIREKLKRKCLFIRVSIIINIINSRHNE